MVFVKSLKSDPLGVVDTRLRMTDPPTDGCFSPFFASFTGFDATDKRQPGSQTEAEINPKQTHRFLEPRESFRGFDSSRQCPRLELDVDVDKYHTLDGLAEPLNPQNTPASRGSREESPESLRCYKMENLRTSPDPQIGEFNFDCFQDSPEASFVSQDDGSESPKPSKLRRLSVGREQWIKPPIAALANHQPGRNGNSKKFGDSRSLLRSVRFSPPASFSSPPRAIRRPLPSIERRQDYIALHRQKKQYRKWNITRYINSQQSPPYDIPTKITQSSAARMPKNYDRHLSSTSSLPYHETRQALFSTRAGSGGDARAVGAGNVADNVADAHVSNGSTIAGKTEQNAPAFLAVSFSLHRPRPAPGTSTAKASKYAFRFRIAQTDLPHQPSPHFPAEFEHTTCNPIIDDLLFHTCFIIPALVVLLPLVFVATHPLTNSRAGAVMLYLARALLYLLMKTIIFVLSRCGVTCSCQWNPDTGHSD
ncbi:uncharacterized protein N7479_004750 [Penicillium vulpinum]|uniref:Uncharacterized protein n=1 Tax=Penicillium vulpinum TaxID=29845 RepID=A0A1V6RSM5_9EURO|nr:uncharacterized protein N7479_004750 [Penicillium vulpinum]KAJ5964874.1 hypothetical protein N7479_004750 [Penicillium vulpinum]OQE04626.1 hypothetical protein PENVUL_c031G07485 [Penicillium vulpinum]